MSAVQLEDHQLYQNSSLESLAKSLGKNLVDFWINPVTGELSLRQSDRVDRPYADLGFEQKSQELDE